MLDLDALRRKSDTLNPLEKELLWKALSLRLDLSHQQMQNMILSTRIKTLEGKVSTLNGQRADLLDTIEELEKRSSSFAPLP